MIAMGASTTAHISAIGLPAPSEEHEGRCEFGHGRTHIAGNEDAKAAVPCFSGWKEGRDIGNADSKGKPPASPTPRPEISIGV